VRSEVLQREKEERNILQIKKREKADLISHILRRNCLLKHVIKGKIHRRVEVTGRRGIRSKQLLDEFKEIGGYFKSNKASTRSPLWRIRFTRGSGPVVRQTARTGRGSQDGGLLFFPTVQLSSPNFLSIFESADLKEM
jgi:hypothetical protein